MFDIVVDVTLFVISKFTLSYINTFHAGFFLYPLKISEN